MTAALPELHQGAGVDESDAAVGSAYVNGIILGFFAERYPDELEAVVVPFDARPG